jgi:hypothetical protein
MSQQQPEEVAPPFEKWEEHLRGIDNGQLANLARDYNWLNGESLSDESRSAFQLRRQAIIKECERRGMAEVANAARREPI